MEGIFSKKRGIFLWCDSEKGRDATPMGLNGLIIVGPRVAALPQPWAERQNPVGIHGAFQVFSG